MLIGNYMFWIKSSSVCLRFCYRPGNPFYEAYHAILVYAETNYQDVVSINNTRYEDGNIHLKVCAIK